MDVITRLPSAEEPTLPPGIPVRLDAAAPSLWRVMDRRGLVIGHIQAIASGEGLRFRARRFHPPSRAFRDLGEFWRAADAVECLRFA